MATRPVFVATSATPAFQEIEVQFVWQPGFAHSQKQKNVRNMLDAFQKSYPEAPVLEVSGRSPLQLGVALSAFNLEAIHHEHGAMSVERAFQGSKVFSDLGQIEQAYHTDSRGAKAIAREADVGHDLIRFRWQDIEWPLEPKTLFYDWLYCSALQQHPELLEQLRNFKAFTDIEFNPEKSFNCQARSCAIAVSLVERGLLDKALDDRETFIGLVYGDASSDESPPAQLTLI
jgi:hypothetical protein